MNAVIYARYSSDHQREESIDAQVRAIENYAKSNNMVIVNKYIDEAKSARTDNRPAFQQMIKDSSKGIFDCVIVHKLDRFSRDRYDSAIYKRTLRNNNIKLISVIEKLDGSPESVVFESLIEGMSEYYSKNLSREVLKGHFENANQFKHNGGHVPFGYSLDKDKKYILNDYEAVAVKQIFEMYANGSSYNDIIKWLTDRNYKTRSNKTFYKNYLFNLLRNKKYTGVYIYNKVGTKNENQPIEIKGGMPTIVSDDLFNKVKKVQEQNTRIQRSTKAKRTYFLTGKLFCGCCGSHMHGRSRKNGRGTSEYSSYNCSAGSKNNCKKISVKRDDIEYSVFNYLEYNVFTDSYINHLANKIQDEYNRLRDESTPKSSNILRKINALENKIENLVDMISDAPALLSEFQSKILKLKEEKQLLQNELTKLSLCKEEEFSKQEIIDFLSLGKNILSKSENEKKIIIDTFVKEIKIDKKNECIELTLYTPSTSLSVVNNNIAVDRFEFNSRHTFALIKYA